jgi:hypothetical protein
VSGNTQRESKSQRQCAQRGAKCAQRGAQRRCAPCVRLRDTVEIEILQERGRASVVPRESKWQCEGMEARGKRGQEQAEIERTRGKR